MFKTLALILITAAFLWKILLHVLDLRSIGKPVPANVADIYDPETYRRQAAYQKEKTRISMIANGVSFAVVFLLILLDVLPHLALGTSPLLQALTLVLFHSLIDTVVNLPINWYDTFRIEGKFGFNRSKTSTFIVDTIRNFLIGLVLTCAITALLVWLHTWLGDGMVILFAVVLFVLILLISFLFPYLSRIANKFTSLEEGELRTKLTSLMEKHGYHVRDIKVMDASRRSTKSNAYFAGMGKSKTIVLYDTLIATSTADEICAVFAHELGHGLHHDTTKNQIFSFINMAMMAVLIWLTVRYPEIYRDFGFAGVNYGLAMLLMSEAEMPIFSPLLGYFVNRHSRKAEYAADRQAVEEGYGEALASGLRTLARQNYANLTPDPLLVELTESHPPISQRLQAIEDAMKKAE